MFGEHHDLHHEFPEYKDKIHQLKSTNHHFARLFDDYHNVDREVRRMEQSVETVSDETLELLKKQRLSLKDELLAMLRAK
jgi:hypothetical protein